MERRLELLLDREYNSDSVSPECKDRVIDYIRTHESILDEGIRNIKGLTKKGCHILASDADSLGGLIDRLFFFIIEGVIKIEQIRRAGNHNIDGLDLLVMESHLHSYAAEVAKVLYGKTGYLYWCEKDYWHSIESVEISAEIGTEEDLLYSAHRYAMAAKSAQEIYYKTGDFRYGERWCEAKKIRAYINFKLGREDYAFDYVLAGNAFRRLADGTENNNRAIHYAREAIYCYWLFLSYFKQHKEQLDFGIQPVICSIERTITTLSQRFGM